jgi:hypothetical protein
MHAQRAAARVVEHAKDRGAIERQLVKLDRDRAVETGFVNRVERSYVL